jgi:hypothetical protein
MGAVIGLRETHWCGGLISELITAATDEVMTILEMLGLGPRISTRCRMYSIRNSISLAETTLLSVYPDSETPTCSS